MNLAPCHSFLKRFLPAALTAAGLAACSTAKIPAQPLSGSNAEALATLTAAQRAQGALSFSTLRDLKVRYRLSWSRLGAGAVPLLADARWRRESDEALDLVGNTSVQLSKGRAGRKFVFRAPGRATVWYNGQTDSREEVIRAAAVVADLHKMCLLGPLYFQRSGVTLETLPSARVAGRDCDQVLAVLQPGFGFADEDRVVLVIDRQNQRLRRLHCTVHGLRRKVPELEIDCGGWAERSGVWWAGEFQERVHSLLTLTTHRWKLLDLQVNRGLIPQAPEKLEQAAGEALQRLP